MKRLSPESRKLLMERIDKAATTYRGKRVHAGAEVSATAILYEFFANLYSPPSTSSRVSGVLDWIEDGDRRDPK